MEYLKLNNETIKSAVKEWLLDETTAEAIYGHISNWDTSEVTNMRAMFFSANAFNQPIGNWDVSKVTDMSFMFKGAESFNQPIGNWDVSNVTNMNSMFYNTSFNQPYNRGFLKHEFNDDTGAIADYNIAIRLDPNYADAYYNRGLSRYLLGDKNGRDRDFLKAKQLGKDDFYLHE